MSLAFFLFFCFTWTIKVSAAGDIKDFSLNGHEDASILCPAVKLCQLLWGVFSEDERWWARTGRGLGALVTGACKVVVGDVSEDSGEDPVDGIGEAGHVDWQE